MKQFNAIHPVQNNDNYQLKSTTFFVIYLRNKIFVLSETLFQHLNQQNYFLTATFNHKRNVSTL